MQIIREVYEGQNAHEAFEAELEKALKARVNYIIIEPARLGDETERWITVGNCLHKTAVLSGVASAVVAGVWTDQLTVSASFCALSVFCTGLYTVSWNYDPCCQYQVRGARLRFAVLRRSCRFVLKTLTYIAYAEPAPPPGPSDQRAQSERVLVAGGARVHRQPDDQVRAPWRDAAGSRLLRVANLRGVQIIIDEQRTPLYPNRHTYTKHTHTQSVGLQFAERRTRIYMRF